MRTIITASLALLLSGCAVAPAAQAVVPPTVSAAAPAAQVSVSPVAAEAASAAQVSIPPVAPGEVSTALASSEAAALTFMREEEKLARDVYLTLAESWSLPVFTNIAASEQIHMDALKTLLDRYGLADPTAGKAQGEFTNPELQALYTQLVARGTTSLPEALAVGAAIEEIDILDLQERTSDATPADVAQVYQQLLQGSYNHLRSFVGQWEAQTGATYQPQYLDDQAYQTILADVNGNRNSGNGGNGGSGNGGNGGNGGGHGNGGNGGGRP